MFVVGVSILNLFCIDFIVCFCGWLFICLDSLLWCVDCV